MNSSSPAPRRDDPKEADDGLPSERRETLAALIECFFPDDGSSPSAGDIGILGYFETTFLHDPRDDRQWYGSPPFAPRSIPQLGWQVSRTPVQFFLDTLGEIDAVCEQLHGKRFAALGSDAQAAVVARLDADQFIEEAYPPTSVFVKMLGSGIQEGVLRDPYFGGNRDGRGWRWLQVEPSRSSLKMRVR